MPNPDRPQAPGYLANLMARLFHEISGEGLAPLGVRSEQFPILIELWFGEGASRTSLCATQEASPGWIDVLVETLAVDGLIDPVPPDPASPLRLTPRGNEIRGAAIAAARRANAAAGGALSEAEIASFMEMMNRVIDALQAARAQSAPR